MNWWQTLIVSTVPVILTLVITNFAESRRRKADSEERERDRSGQVEARTEERRASIEDHWRNERFERMSTFVAIVGDLTRLTSEMQWTADWALEEDGDLSESLSASFRTHVFELYRKVDKELTDSVMSVALIASQRFYAEALALLDDVRQLVKPIHSMAVNGVRKQPKVEALESINNFAHEMSIIHTRLINTVREELTGDTDSWFRANPH